MHVNKDETRDPQRRLTHGRDQRDMLSCAKLGDITNHKKRSNPIDLLLKATEGRLPGLLPKKYGRMSASPFAFFRGAVSIMAADLSAHRHTGLIVQLCGDAHVQNLGCFEGPDGRLIFDLNDFDETIAGPWEWDVKRMAASVVLAGLESTHSQSSCEDSVESFLDAYFKTMSTLADLPVLTAARMQIHRVKKAAAVSAALRQAERAQPLDLLKKYTKATRGKKTSFKKVEGVLWPVGGQERQNVLRALPQYRETLAPERLHWFDFFNPVDVAFKIVGTGSVGLRDYVVLMEGNGKDDPVFLQIKQEVASAYAPYLKHQPYDNQGLRVVEGQRRIQPLSDLMLGWTRIGEHDFLVRQLNDHKGSIDLDRLRGDGLTSLATLAGELLARGHARSGDALAIKGYIGGAGKIVKSLVRFGVDYADLTNADFELFQRAIHEERIQVAE